jgi:hypothetical protein
MSDHRSPRRRGILVCPVTAARVGLVMPAKRSAPSLTPRGRMLRDPVHGDADIRLRDRRKRVSAPTWRKIADPAHCSTCGTLWACEVSLALKIIESLLGA